MISFGCTKTDFVEDRLQFAVKSWIVNMWPSLNEMPIRIVFEFDNVDVIKVFDPSTKLSNSFINEIKILPINLCRI